MPPKRQRSGTTTHVTNGAPRSMAAKKRKNTERSDDDNDSDFETRPFQSKPQKKQTQSSKSRSKSQHSVPLPSDSSTLSLENEKQGRRGGVTTEANGQEKENRKGAVEMKRVKRLVTEEDRGFVFTRKLPSTPALTAASTTTTTIAKTSKAKNGGSAQEPEARSVTPLPPSPERTPSREAYTHGPSTKTKPSRSQDHRSKPAVASKAAAVSTSESRPRHQPQYTPERTTDLITAIPMRETPMIKKNKDLRSGSRRSSFAMRGKRASSIGNGFSALPHPSVDSKSFYRHISADVAPPVRMKQLMAWCSRKTIDNNGETKTETGHKRSATALKIAKLVEEEALAMLVGGKFSVSWYSRPADMKGSKTSSNKPKKPHAQNVSNLKRLQEYEAQIAKLQQEDDQWTKVITSYNNFHAALLDNGPALPPGNEPIMVPETLTEDIELDLLTADERSLWDKHIKNNHQPSTPIAAKAGSSASRVSRERDSPKSLDDKKWMAEIMSSLETEVDQLRDTLYVASRFDKVTRQYTDQVLEQIAIALDERQRPRLMESPQPPPPVSSTLITSSSAESTIAPSASLTPQPPSHSVLSPDVADDPREILRALSRLSL
ncbi:hypothetical protein BG000_009150 [Podila horticola]|nr:hypothetical protein BG000_009150 [Podila horticola]